MVEIEFSGLLLTGVADYNVGITDVQVIDNGSQGATLVVISASSQGLISWSLGEHDQFPTLVSITAIGSQSLAGISANFTTAETSEGDFLLTTGVGADSIFIGQIDREHGVEALEELDTGSDLWISSATLSDGTWVFSELDGGLTLIDYSSGLNSAEINFERDGNSDPINLLDSIQVNGIDILIAGSTIQGNLATYVFDGTSLSIGDDLQQGDETGFMLPTDLTVSIGDQAFLIVGSANGANGTLSTFLIDELGTLNPTDQILDSRDSRFGSIQSLATIPYARGALVVAGGGDDGVSLFALNGNGRLVHLDSFADSIEAGLTNVVALDLHLVDTALQIFISSQADEGLTVLTVDLSDFGIIGNDAPSSEPISGTSADDVLFGTTGADVFLGSGGADLFVITYDIGHTDTIRGFSPTEDRLDLSGWSGLYSADSLDITMTDRGARIAFRNQVLVLESTTGTSLEPAAIRSLIELDITRLPSLEPINVVGNSEDNIIEGNWTDDTLAGGGGNDTLFGFAGDDTLFEDEGSDTIYGGAGNDTLILNGNEIDFIITGLEGNSITLSSASGTDVISGVETFEFNDVSLDFETLTLPENLGLSIVGTVGSDTIVATVFDDWIDGSRGADQLTGKDGNDLIWGSGGNDVIRGNQGMDTLGGGLGNDTIYGDNDGDSLEGNLGDDQLYGGSGEDTIKGGSGADIIYGGNGVDNIEGNLGDDQLYGGDDEDNINGGYGADIIFGDNGNDIINGDNGNDIIKGGNGIDIIYGGNGVDNINGNLGDDQLYGGSSEDTIKGGYGADIIFGDNGNDIINGDNGNDIINGNSGADEIFGGDNEDIIKGGNGADIIYGGNGVDSIEGNLGDDQLYGGDDEDNINGGYGADIISGDNGNDVLTGNAGKDDISGGDGNDIINGGSGNDIINGGNGGDFITGDSGDDQITGNGGNDILYGGLKSDLIFGGFGQDSLFGGDGQDELLGGWGGDALDGGKGADILIGGDGADSLSGGDGADIFIFVAGDGHDTINDFNPENDLLQLSGSFLDGLHSGHDVMAEYAVLVGNDILLDFGSSGSILVRDLSDILLLAAEIEIV